MANDTVAFLGTGTMGLPMARNLARAGLEVRAWNRSRERAEPLTDDGAKVCDTPAEAARGADVLVTMLTDADAVLAAVEGDDPALPALTDDAVWLQMSTVGLEGCTRLQDAARRAGVGFVDAPVLGTKQPAEQGKLKIFAAGPEEFRPRAEPVFAPMGTLFRWLPDAGQASALKLVANAWVLALTDGVAASIALARALELDPQLFLDAIEGSASDSPYAHVKGDLMIRGDYPPSFGLSAALKDAELVVAAGDAHGVRGELVAAVRDDLRRARDAGYGDQDMSAMYVGHLPGDRSGQETDAAGG